jgi:hypothetical protein
MIGFKPESRDELPNVFVRCPTSNCVGSVSKPENYPTLR